MSDYPKQAGEKGGEQPPVAMQPMPSGELPWKLHPQLLLMTRCCPDE